MIQRKVLLLALALLLTPVGLVAAQSSTNFVTERFVVVGGGSADSASFSVTSVIGQPATDLVNSSNYKVSGGFLYPSLQEPFSDQKTWLPLIIK
jgi:hypothetical protein